MVPQHNGGIRWAHCTTASMIRVRGRENRQHPRTKFSQLGFRELFQEISSPRGSIRDAAGDKATKLRITMKNRPDIRPACVVCTSDQCFYCCDHEILLGPEIWRRRSE